VKKNLARLFIFSSVFSILLVNNSTSQVTVTIGTGTSVNSTTSYPAPYGNWFWGAKHQFIIRASELTAAGVSAGPIYSLAFNVSAINGVSLINFTVKMKNTTSAQTTTVFETTGLTTVWGPQNYTETSGWNTHTFSSAFNWDGTSSLLIETCFNNTSYTNNARTYYSSTSFNSTVYRRSDASGVCGYTTGTTTLTRPNMQLTVGPAADDDVGVISLNSPATGCGLSASETVTVTVKNFGDYTQTSIPVSYQMNGGTVYTETISTTLTSGSTVTHSFATTVDLSAVGNYSFDTWTSLSSDTVTINDGLSNFIVINSNSVSTFPWTEDFETFIVGIPGTLMNDWTNETGDDIDWRVHTGSTTSSSTGPTGDHTTGSGIYLYTEASGNSNKTALLTSPCIDISGLTAPVLEFWYHMYGSSMGTLAVDIYSGGTWTLNVDSISGNQGNTWLFRQINLSSFAGSGITIRFRGRTGTSYTSDMAIDDILVFDAASPPVSDFSADFTFTCNGTVNFTDQSSNYPTSWLWDFGDGNTSTTQNPTHTYTSSGAYTVSLVATNAYGSDTEVKTNYINVSLSGGPINASCSPVTTGYCCGMGIYNVTFNTINNTTNNGVESYQDYTCSSSATVIVGKKYYLAIETGTTYQENVVVWIDFDNDGVFNASDIIFNSVAGYINHTDSILIPSTSVLGTPLRMRVASDYYSAATPTPCTNVVYGQFEDYTIIIQPDTFPPATNFTVDATISCNGVVNFTDLSSNSPFSWFWDFGDGATDTTQNPTHTYTVDSTYTITLVSCNTHGCDTLVKPNYITISLGGGPITASCTPATTAYCCGFGITDVTFNSISNPTNDGVDGYQDYTCSQGTNVTEGQSYTLSITTDNPSTHNTVAWIDYDNSGSFDASEIVLQAFSELYPSATVTIPTGAVTNTSLRMRISADHDVEPIPTPCADVTYGQVEDYTVTIIPNTSPPVADFSASDNNSCDGIITFTDLSQNVPASWLWDFGDGNTSTVQNPTYTYTSDSNYTVKLMVTNSYGSDSIVKTNYVNVTLGAQPIAPSCTPATISYCCGYGIYNVTFYTMTRYR